MARTKLIIIMIVFVSLAVVLTVMQPRLILIWNGSGSAPVGFYRVQNMPIDVGAYVLIEPSEHTKELILERRYLPPNVPLLKRVAALSGDKICRQGQSIFINGKPVETAKKVDSQGREMPQWSGCFRLEPHETFLLNSNENSLDGRYFGPSDVSHVIGVAKPIWIVGGEK